MFKFNCYLPRLMYKVNKVGYGKNLKLIGWPFIFRYPKAKITIGDNCTINSNFFSNFIGLYQRTIFVARDQGEIKIGNNVGSVKAVTVNTLSETSSWSMRGGDLQGTNRQK